MRKPEVITLQVVAVGAYLALSFFLYRGMLGMGADALLFLNVLAQLVLIIMGVFVTLRDAWPRRHPWIVIAAFGMAGCVAMFATYRQNQLSARGAAEAQRQLVEAQRKADESSAKLSASMERLGTQTGEIQRVQGLNTELQESLMGQSGQLIDSTKRIIDLSKEAIDTTTGGNSFCYMYLSPQFSSKGLTPVFSQMGQQPLYDIQVQIVNIEKLDELEKQSKSKGQSLSFFNEANLFMTIGNMRPRSAHIPAEYGQVVLAGDSTMRNVNAYFYARNGDWNQQIQLRRVGNTWSQATRVFQMSARLPVKLHLTQ